MNTREEFTVNGEKFWTLEDYADKMKRRRSIGIPIDCDSSCSTRKTHINNENHKRDTQ